MNKIPYDAEISVERPAPDEISDYRYSRALRQITLLRVMEVITNDEVRRIHGLLKSPDYENWHVAEELIKKLLD